MPLPSPFKLGKKSKKPSSSSSSSSSSTQSASGSYAAGTKASNDEFGVGSSTPSRGGSNLPLHCGSAPPSPIATAPGAGPSSSWFVDSGTPNPSPLRGVGGESLGAEDLGVDLDPFNISGSVGGGDGEAHDAHLLLSEVAMSYAFPCKSFMKSSPLVMLVATISCILTALAIRSYTPNDGSSNDYSIMFDNILSGARYIDLTHSLTPSIPTYYGFSPPTFYPGKSSRDMENFATVGQEYTYAEHGFITTSYVFSNDQLGTLLTVPAGWNEMGATVSDVGASVSLRPLVVIDVRSGGEGYAATVDDIKKYEQSIRRTINPGSIVVFRSDWSLKYDDYLTDGLPSIYPQVSLEALRFLHEERKILMHGVEPFDNDMTDNKEGEAWIAHNNKCMLKGLKNLEKVPKHGCLASIGFMKTLGGTGAFARVVAICPEIHMKSTVEFGEKVTDDLKLKEYPLRRDDNGILRVSLDASPTEYCKESTSLGCNGGVGVWEE